VAGTQHVFYGSKAALAAGFAHRQPAAGQRTCSRNALYVSAVPSHWGTLLGRRGSTRGAVNRGLARAKLFHDGTIRPLIAVAGASEGAQGLDHASEFRRARLELGDVRKSQRFDIRAGVESKIHVP
jgi:hypothetical protein